MEKIVIEVIQNDGITVKERIIRFFEQKVDRETAEMFYDHAVLVASESISDSNSIKIFDNCITIICQSLELDENILSQQIIDHTPKS